MTEVVVVGGGIAACAAALSAARIGAKVTVIDGGGGATHLSGGVWDIASDLRETAIQALDPGISIAKRIRSFAESRPEHPYARLSDDPVSLVREAHALLLPALGGYRALDLDSEGALVVTDLGVIRRVATAQHEVLDLSNRPNRVGVAAMYGYRTCDASFLVKSLSAFLRASVVSEISVEVSPQPELNAKHCAERLETSDRATLKNAWVGAKTDVMLCAPVLGLRDGSLFSELKSARAGAIGEISCPMNGVQGIRLGNMIMRALDHAGCSRRMGRVQRIACRADRVEVTLNDGERFSAAAMVLCTGKHVSGGLEVRSAIVHEPILDLPMFAAGKPQALVTSAQGADPAMLFGNDLVAGGPGFRQGVGYDRDLRALTHYGQPVSERLFVAGALLDGVDAGGDGSGFGCAATTGFVAGKNAARCA